MTSNKATASTVLKYSPRKSRLIINKIRGMRLSEAFLALRTVRKGQAKKVSDLLRAAMNNMNLTEDDAKNYVISSIVAEEAQKYYRIVPRARGSAFRIRRRYSRVKVNISSDF